MATATATPSAESIATTLARVPEGYEIIHVGAGYYAARVIARDVETSAVIGYRDLSYDGTRLAIERDPSKLLALIEQHQRAPHPPASDDESDDARARGVPVFGALVKRVRRERRASSRATSMRGK